MSSNEKISKDLITELNDNQKTIKEEYERYLGLKLTIFEFWEMFLPILNNTSLNEGYK